MQKWYSLNAGVYTSLFLEYVNMTIHQAVPSPLVLPGIMAAEFSLHMQEVQFNGKLFLAIHCSDASYSSLLMMRKLYFSLLASQVGLLVYIFQHISFPFLSIFFVLSFRFLFFLSTRSCVMIFVLLPRLVHTEQCKFLNHHISLHGEPLLGARW